MPRPPAHRGWRLPLVLALAVLPATLAAEPIEERIDAQREAIAATQAEREAASAALDEQQKRLAFLEDKTEELDAERARLEARQQALAARDAELRDGLAERRAELERRLQAAYPLTRGSALQALLGDGDALQADRDLHYLQSLIQPVQAARRALEAQRAELAANREAVAQTERELDQASERLDAHHRTVRQALEEQQRLLAQLGRTLDEQQQALKALLERKRRLDREVAAVRRAAPSQRPEPPERPTGTNVSTDGIPVAGRVQRGFGESLPQGQLRAEGVEFGAAAGSAVRAIADGEVVFAGALKGWGQLVMLRHHNEYLSLYAHCRSLGVSKGQRVARGQQVCDSGIIDANREGLYVEVRRGNRPIDPARWSAWREAIGS